MKISFTRINAENTVNSTQVATLDGKLIGVRICIIHRA